MRDSNECKNDERESPVNSTERNQKEKKERKRKQK